MRLFTVLILLTFSPTKKGWQTYHWNLNVRKHIITYIPTLMIGLNPAVFFPVITISWRKQLAINRPWRAPFLLNFLKKLTENKMNCGNSKKLTNILPRRIVRFHQTFAVLLRNIHNRSCLPKYSTRIAEPHHRIAISWRDSKSKTHKDF